MVRPRRVGYRGDLLLSICAQTLEPEDDAKETGFAQCEPTASKICSGWWVGAGTQIRTADLLITNQLLCLTELFRQCVTANFNLQLLRL